jgi:SAM-dependent methyltransferase
VVTGGTVAVRSYPPRLMAREASTDMTMLERLVSPPGKDIVDVGCGGGALVRALAERGARPLGVEISEQQLAPALAADPAHPERYMVGSGQDLPLPDSSVDAVVFMRTLHHVPPSEMPDALGEAHRVLRDGGIVYAAEPLAEGAYFELVSLVEDEREVREAAQIALEHADASGLERVLSVEYEVELRLADVSALRRRIVSVDPARAEIFDTRATEINDAFDRLGEPDSTRGGRRFAAPMRADVLARAPA